MQRHQFSSAPAPAFTEIPEVFDRIKQVASPEISKKVIHLLLKIP